MIWQNVKVCVAGGTHYLLITHIGHESVQIECEIPGAAIPQTIFLKPEMITRPGGEIVDYRRNDPYLNDAPILNPYHVGAVFSGIDASFIGELELYPGVAPAKYGNFGGGMVRLVPKLSPIPETVIELGTLSSKFRSRQTVGKAWQSSFLFRLLTLDFLAMTLAQERNDYGFFDGAWANRWLLSGSLAVEAHVYLSQENLPRAIEGREPYNEAPRKQPVWRNVI